MENSNYKTPFYELEIKAFMCSFKIEINGIPAFFSYESQQIATDWPINMFIIKSGKQSICYQVLPLYENGILDKEAYLELTIYVRESNGLYLKRQKINQFIFRSIDQENNNIKQSYFNAQVPFELDNYMEIGVNLSEINYEKLKDELWFQYKKIFDAISLRNVSQYNELTKKRFDAMQKSFYLDEIKKNYYTQNPFKIFRDHNLDTAPKHEYHLEIYGKGHLCSLQIKNRTPGLCVYILDDNEKKEIVFESAIFYVDKNQNYVLYR